MPITKDNGRQYPLYAKVDFTYTDLGTAVTTSTILEAAGIPTNARITSGNLVVTTAWVGPTAATADVGDAIDPDRYSASPIDLKTTGVKALTITGFQYAGEDTIDIDLLQSVAVSSAGVGFLEFEYVIDDRAHEVQPE